MKRRNILRGLALMFLFSLPFLGASQVTTNASGSNPARGPVSPLSQNINDFSFALLRQIGTTSAGSGNTVVSPMSIYESLAMCYVAAGGQTRAQLATSLHFPSDNNTLIKELATLRRQLRDDANVKSGKLEFTNCNSLWLDSTYAKFRKSYENLIQNKMSASLHAIPFRDRVAAANQINQWVSQQTHSLITNLTNLHDFQSKSRKDIRDEPALAAINAVYFNADWFSRFEKDETRPLPFHASPDATQQVMMMHQFGMQAYAENDDVKFLELPYVGKSYCMYLILPKQNIPVANLLKMVSADTIKQLDKQAMDRNVDVLLPKYETNTSLNAQRALKEMGVNDAFNEKVADFDAMIHKTPEAFRIYLNSLKQKAVIKVHEQGTQAAAATVSSGYSFGCSAAAAGPTAVFHADHPFMYLIVDRSSGTVLFAGWYSKPVSTTVN